METDLERSLTEMDWLARLNVGGVLGGGLIDLTADGTDQYSDSSLSSCASSVSSSSSTAVPSHSGRGSKPPYSYTTLIMSAISSTPNKRMALGDIYSWIMDNFPYYRNAGPGWKVGGGVVHYTNSNISISNQIYTNLTFSSLQTIERWGMHAATILS